LPLLVLGCSSGQDKVPQVISHTGTPDSGSDTGSPGTQDWDFITREGDRLVEGDQEFRFVSFNIPNLHMLEDPDWHIPAPWEQADAMASIAQMGGRVARTYTLSVGESSNEVPRHVTGPGEFSEELFVALDHAIAQAQAHEIRLIIPFVDQWQWWGGIADYAAFRDLEGDDFWTDAQVKEDFQETIRFVLERVNTVTGTPYAEDPTILAWETGNELDSPSDWTAEMAGFIRSLAPAQLIVDGHYGIDEASLEHDDIDIVSNHYYWPDGYGEDYAAAASADRAIAQGKRPFIVGEFGLIGTESYEALMDVVIDEGISGALIWSLRYHAVDGGFYWHTEVSDGDWLVRAYHWPGFDSGSAYDERGVLSLMRESAYRIQGLDVPQLDPPAAPSILSHDAEGLTWQGAAGASSYTLERAQDPHGEWSEVAVGLDDAVEANTARVLDESHPSGVDLYYRMVAVHDGQSSEPSAIYGPLRWPSQFIDTLDDMSQMSSHDTDLKIDDANTSYFGGDGGRLCRTEAGEQQATWMVEGELTAIEAGVFFWPHEDRPPIRFETSTDGSSYTEVPAGETEMGGDWEEVIYTVSEIPEGSTFLRFSFEDHDGNVWNPQLAHLVLTYE
jgi:hypothetical protein